MRIETQILNQLIHNEEYTRKVIPFLSKKYFHDEEEQKIFTTIKKHIEKYNSNPTIEILNITFGEEDGGEKLYENIFEYLKQFEPADIDCDWLVDKTEEFCQERAIHNAIMESIQIMDGKGNKSRGVIPELLTDALSVSFDKNIGHDWLDDFSERWDFYHRTEKRLPFDLDYLNKITKGGLPPKSLTCFLGGTGTGKSLVMCHMASANLMDNKKVLYITKEMAEERIAERIDANLLDVSLNEIEELPKSAYMKKVERIRKKTEGKLVIKEYPTSTAGADHFRHLLNELKLKKNFVPDIIYIDYLNICCSSRLKFGANVNSYTYVKAIAEELRGLAVEQGLPIVTATQTTRSGYSNSDPGLEDTSESFGLPATVDLMIALITSDELENLNQMMFKQLKNRFGDPAKYKRFVVGIDRAKMRLYDVEQSAQEEVTDDRPVMDNTSFGERFDGNPIAQINNHARMKKFGELK